MVTCLANDQRKFNHICCTLKHNLQLNTRFSLESITLTFSKRIFFITTICYCFNGLYAKRKDYVLCYMLLKHCVFSVVSLTKNIKKKNKKYINYFFILCVAKVEKVEEDLFVDYKCLSHIKNIIFYIEEQ